MSLRANHGLPSISRRDTMHNALLNERLWQWEIEESAASVDHPRGGLGLKQMLGSVAEEAGQDDEEIVEAIQSSLPQSKGHRAEKPPLEAPMPEKWAQ
eukprot:1732610-Pleurochrysis_carterae.AAC.1